MAASGERVRADGISHEELALAARNHGMPLEALRYPITPLGLHYLLSHYDIPYVEAGTWHLAVGGLVERSLRLTLDDLQGRPAVDAVVTMECAGNGRARLEPRPFSQPWLDEAVGTARWTGTPLAPLLREAGLTPAAVEVLFTGLDRGTEDGVEQAFQRSLPVEEALRDDVLLVWAIGGVPLPPQHGYPLRLLVPGWYGMASVKWLSRIEAIGEPFAGHQQAVAYRLRRAPGEVGEPLSRIRPRALVVPPGIPAFPTRARTLAAGHTELEGRAWSGFAAIARVDVSTDGGSTWHVTELERDVDEPHAWVRWQYGWDAVPGEADIVCRATDQAGNEQPLEPEWNLHGYANNAVQRVTVTVVS
jgi:DMSO/TMAO reductase YedYZ molybdopterin-dependent catalytic subunit